MYALALGHEDLNDHGELRHDPALQTAAGRLEALASSVDAVPTGAARRPGDGGGGSRGAV